MCQMRTWPKKTSAASDEGGGHLDVLRAEQQPAAIVAIGDDAADEREQQDRQLPEEIVEPEEERRLGEVEDEPALRDLLHPRADRRGEGAEPEDAEIAVSEGGERALQERLREQPERRARRRAAWLAPSNRSGWPRELLSYNSRLIRTLHGRDALPLDRGKRPHYTRRRGE